MNARALDFPANPSTGDKHKGWSWDGEKWVAMASASGVAIVGAGLGIEVDSVDSSEPVVSIDRSETDAWYLAADAETSKWETVTGGIAYSDGNVGIGTDNPSYPLTVQRAGTTYAGVVSGDTDLSGILFGRDSNKSLSRVVHDNTDDSLALWTSSFERMRIDANGNIRLTGTAPSAEDDISTINFFNTSSNMNLASITGKRTAGGTNYGSLIFNITSSGVISEAMRIDSSGNVTATGNVTAYSDERLKDNVETLDGSKVYDMRGVSFTKDGEAGSGVIAQELQKVAPELVHEGGEYLSVAYGNLVGYLIEAVKDLKAEIEELKNGAS